MDYHEKVFSVHLWIIKSKKSLQTTAGDILHNLEQHVHLLKRINMTTVFQIQD